MMTLQLEVGKTYRARNGDVVRIDRKLDEDDQIWFRGDNRYFYCPDGSCPGARTDHALINEESDAAPFARVISALDAAEHAESEAMERIRESLAELRAAVDAAQKAMRGEG